jgi:cell division protein FtsL
LDATRFAVNKHVRNSLVVREVDETRQRQLWRWAGVALVLVAGAVVLGWQHVELIKYGYLIEGMQQERAGQEAVTRHLQLEIETLQSPQRIEQLAIERLHMVVPPPDSVVVLERIVPSEAPPSSIVASR